MTLSPERARSSYRAADREASIAENPSLLHERQALGQQALNNTPQERYVAGPVPAELQSPDNPRIQRSDS